MVSRVWISEFSVLGVTSNGGAQIASLPSLVDQSTLDISGGVQSSAAFNAATRYIRVFSEVQCAVKGASGATTASLPVAAFTPEYFGVQPGGIVSVIANP